MEIYNQRKLRNAESTSIKTIFNHIANFFCPPDGCIAKMLTHLQYLISAAPDLNEQAIVEHNFLHELLQFIKDVYYYCQDEFC
jgi:hypothetical protein